MVWQVSGSVGFCVLGWKNGQTKDDLQCIEFFLMRTQPLLQSRGPGCMNWLTLEIWIWNHDFLLWQLNSCILNSSYHTDEALLQKAAHLFHSLETPWPVNHHQRSLQAKAFWLLALSCFSLWLIGPPLPLGLGCSGIPSSPLHRGAYLGGSIPHSHTAVWVTSSSY